MGEDINQRAADDKILFDLGIIYPRYYYKLFYIQFTGDFRELWNTRKISIRLSRGLTR